MLRRTKIVCTIGPATDSKKQISALIGAGMNVARLNFSHGDHAGHARRIELIRELAAKASVPVAILQDLAGPKLRIGRMAQPVHLQAGQSFTLTNRDLPGTQEVAPLGYHELPQYLHSGDTILLADGRIELRVLETDGQDVTCRVVVGGELDSNQGINLPHRSLPVVGLTDKDRVDLQFGLHAEVDYVAMSFVREAADIACVKEIMAHEGRSAPVIAKIEKHEALRSIHEIVEAADGLMVARGDLAVETSMERVPLAQKMLIERCNRLGKPVITATQMLASMVDSPRPTRAEVADVANAVLDGTDAVMLSEETAVGHYPIQAVQMMDRILRTAETRLAPRDWLPVERHEGKVTIQAGISHAATLLARELKAAAILTPTQTGTTARMVGRYRPQVPIVGLSENPETVRRLALVWGVYPVLIDREKETTDGLIEQAKAAALSQRVVHPGELVVVAAGLPTGRVSSTNFVRVDRIDSAPAG